MKIKNNYISEITKKIMQHKLMTTLIALGFVSFIFSIILLIGGNFSKRPDSSGNIPSNQQSTSGLPPSKKPFNLFGIFGTDENDESAKSKSTDKGLTNIHTGSFSAPLPSNITQIAANGTTSSKTLSTGGTTQTAQGTIITSGNIQTGVTSNTQQDNISIKFQNPDGTVTEYIPPGTPPDEVRWGRYTNTKSNYAINFPVNWQFVYTIDEDGYEGIALYPPGVNKNDSNSPFIGFGISKLFLLPNGDSTSGNFVTSLTVDGISGNVYTNGPLGSSHIASVLNYKDDYFGLSAAQSDATFAYVYYYMLYSLTFNTQ